MEIKKMYFKSEEVGKANLSCNPEEEMGFDYELYDDYTSISKPFYYDAGIVNIDNMIDKLQKMKVAGANYVSIDYHSDHQEYDIYGINFQRASDAEVTEYLTSIETKKQALKDKEIKDLEKKLQALKNA